MPNRAFLRGDRKPKKICPNLMAKLAARLSLKRAGDAVFIWIGDCPICGGARTLMIWQLQRRIVCSACGLDGGFGAAPEPEKAFLNEIGGGTCY